MASGTLYRTIGRPQAPSREKRERPCSSTGFFMMDNLLYSRMESGHPSNEDFYDEDVNVYVAGLLESLMDPSRHETMRDLVVPWDASLFESGPGRADHRTRYLAYRANADFILVHLGIFDNPRGKRPGSRPWLGLGAEAWAGRGKAYYRIAQSHCEQASRRRTAMSEIMGKLADGFEDYVKVLSVMRIEYFNLVASLSSGELFHLELSARRQEMQASLGRLRDEFLDAYSAYLRDGSENSRAALERAAEEVRSVDPSFRFATGPSR